MKKLLEIWSYILNLNFSLEKSLIFEKFSFSLLNQISPPNRTVILSRFCSGQFAPKLAAVWRRHTRLLMLPRHSACCTLKRPKSYRLVMLNTFLSIAENFLYSNFLWNVFKLMTNNLWVTHFMCLSNGSHLNSFYIGRLFIHVFF